MTDLKIGVIGTGYFSQFHYDAWSRLDGTTVAAICSLDKDRSREVADTYGIELVFDDFEKMLNEASIDLLDIAAPPQTHAEITAKALNLGIPTICQKPFTTSLDEARKLVDLSEQTQIPLFVHENFRFQPWYREIFRQLQSGRIGQVYQICFRLRPGDGQGPRAYLDRQPYFQTMERFLIHETAIHFIDVFRYLMGPVSSAFASLRRLNPVIAGEDAGYVIFEFENGTVGLLDGNRLVDHPAQSARLTMGEMMIEGSKGVISLNGDGELHFREAGSAAVSPIDYTWQDRGFAGDCVYNLQKTVIDAVLSKSSLEISAKNYLHNLMVEEAIYQSHENGRKIFLTP